jgi:hypothetical protein
MPFRAIRQETSLPAGSVLTFDEPSVETVIARAAKPKWSCTLRLAARRSPGRSVRVAGDRGRTQVEFQQYPENASQRETFACSTQAGGGPPGPAVGGGPGGVAPAFPAASITATATTATTAGPLPDPTPAKRAEL